MNRFSKMFILLSLMSSPVFATACLSEDKFAKFDQAEILSFSVENEVSPSLVLANERRISVKLGADSDLSAAVVSSIHISSLASASVQEGDSMDISDTFVLVVTSEDGKKVEWTVEGESEGQPSLPPIGGAGGGDGPGDCASYLVTYQTTGIFEITNTPLAAGDGVYVVGPGELSLRFIPTGPASSAVSLIAYEMPQQFVVDAPGALSTTDTHASAGPDVCGLAQGALSSGILSWKTCDYGPAPPLGTTNWSADDVIGGDGCIRNYTVQGEVTCEGTFCAASGVIFPLTIDDNYPQPLNAFEFNEDFSTFTMRSLGAPASGAGKNGVELPNKEPSRSWIGLDGTQLRVECEEIPLCE